MAADTNDLMEALGIKAAHVAGASMGGMIAQLLTINFPARVLSLTSIMSTTGNHYLPGPTSEATAVLLRKRADPTVDMALSIQNSLDAQKVRLHCFTLTFVFLYSIAETRNFILRCRYYAGQATRSMKTLRASTYQFNSIDHFTLVCPSHQSTVCSFHSAYLFY